MSHHPRILSELEGLRATWPQAGFYIASSAGITPALICAVDPINTFLVALGVQRNGESQAYAVQVPDRGEMFEAGGSMCSSAVEAVRDVLRNAAEVVK